MAGSFLPTPFLRHHGATGIESGAVLPAPRLRRSGDSPHRVGRRCLPGNGWAGRGVRVPQIRHNRSRPLPSMELGGGGPDLARRGLRNERGRPSRLRLQTETPAVS